MPIRTIDAPGIEIHEIDKSQYSPAMTGTKVLVTGFANSGEDYTPMIFTSKSAWLNYYGEPDNEAERYFYTASMEVLNQNGVVNCCKLPYENEARDKFVGQKYKLLASNTKELITVKEKLNSADFTQVASVLENSESYIKDVISFYLETVNVTDSTDKKNIQGFTSLNQFNEQPFSGERSDDKTIKTDDTFFTVYSKYTNVNDLKDAFKEEMTKAQLVSYINDLSAETFDTIPRLDAYYFIDNKTLDQMDSEVIEEYVSGSEKNITEDDYSKYTVQDISVIMACDNQANYAVLTARNIVETDSELTSDFKITAIETLQVNDPDANDVISGVYSDNIFAVVVADREINTMTFFENNNLYVRHVNGIDSIQIVKDENQDHEVSEECFEEMCSTIRNTNFILKNGNELGITIEEAKQYYREIQENTEAIRAHQVEAFTNSLKYCEIKQADVTVDKYWELIANGSPSLYDMTEIDEYRTDESRVGTNEILIVDKTRKAYNKVAEDKLHKDMGQELIGVFPIITTAANALYAQSMINVDKSDVLDYETIKDVKTLLKDGFQNVMTEGELSSTNIISQRLNNKHTEEDNDEDFFDSVALEANNYFSSISLQADGGFDRENLKKIGVVVVKAFLDASAGNKISFRTVESFVGSLDRNAKNPNTGATVFIDTLVNEQSEYINVFTNCMPTDALMKKYNEEIDILILPHENADVASLGFYQSMCVENIDVSESILKSLDVAFDKVTDINERELDIVVDAGISNIAQFIKTVYGSNAGFYDPASPDAAMWKCKKDNDVKMWKTVIMKFDNFCKNVRKDCMFIADGPRPFCLQGQKKIVRPSKPTNTIDANILPFVKYLTGVNTSYGAGYCDWFQVADEFSGDYFWCPPSVKACGVYIYTDLNFNYWDAPAGLNRGLVAALDVAFSPTIKQAGQIYTKCWNYAINYPADGIVLEGQKTLQTKPSALDRVNVRRLMLRLERAVYKVLRYVVYEGNTAYMRQRVVDLIKPYFEEAKVGGGLYDYKIVCDDSNNTPTTIDRNELHIAIGIKPVKTIEFIVVNFVLLSTGASWDEML